jgi:pyridoxal phosphate enzyme (YggS family)
LAPLNVCLQVNIDAEPQKEGADVGEVASLAELTSQLPGLKLRGLMAIPQLLSTSGGAAAESFERMKILFEGCRAAGHAVDTLSMGMSADMESAILAGSTMVRIGTDLFGHRS